MHWSGQHGAWHFGVYSVKSVVSCQCPGSIKEGCNKLSHGIRPLRPRDRHKGKGGGGYITRPLTFLLLILDRQRDFRSPKKPKTSDFFGQGMHYHMGQIPQVGENGQNVALFLFFGALL